MLQRVRLSSIVVAAVLAAAAPFCAAAEPTTKPMSVRLADSVMARTPDPVNIERDGRKDSDPKWSYSVAFVVRAVAELADRTGDAKYPDYARRYVKAFIDDSGKFTSKSYEPSTYKLDDVAPGRLLLLLHRQTKEPGYLAAASTLNQQLLTQPRTADGGFWHKQVYPHQLWLDGIYMDAPFLAEFGRVTNDPSRYDEAVHQIVTVFKHNFDPKTNLAYHGWDESRKEKWADPKTGLSQNFWGRGLGWYVMGVVEVLELLPKDHPRRAELRDILAKLADGVARVQDPSTGVWWQVLDQGGREGNYLESSASAMFVYGLAKGVRLGELDPKYMAVARKGYHGILKQFVETDAATGLVTLKDTCRVAGLGGKPYRDGTYAYYISEAKIPNDPKGVAPFILACLELEQASQDR